MNGGNCCTTITITLGTDITSNGDSVAIADSLGGFPGSHTGVDDTYDAFRHAYGSALLSKAFGDTISKIGMTHHENANPSTAKARNMDEWNNNVGREEYHRWQEAKDANQTTDSLEKWIYDRVKEGKTINDLNDTRQWTEPPFPWEKIQDAINDLFKSSQRTPPPRLDPLTFDLDGDGLETTGFNAANPVYFDHDVNGVKEGTGWVLPDDGLLVLDRNSNGLIDNGTELFGDHTPLITGGNASDGFAALAQEDTNLDGTVNGNDAHFSNLRVWRDLNQDGLSQSNELFTLAAQNIASINVAQTAHSQLLANGNQIADLGSYVRTDGNLREIGETSQLADINFTTDTFHRQFGTIITPTPEIANLPDMHGSGAVRDLREAATLSPVLASLLSQFSMATSRSEQFTILDELLTAWADTSGLAPSLEARVSGSYLVQNSGSMLNRVGN